MSGYVHRLLSDDGRTVSTLLPLKITCRARSASTRSERPTAEPSEATMSSTTSRDGVIPASDLAARAEPKTDAEQRTMPALGQADSSLSRASLKSAGDE